MTLRRWRLADSHVHLEQYPAEARAGLVERAQAAGVECLLAVSVSLASSRRTLALAERCPDRVLPAVGVHPKWLRGQSVDELERLAADRKVRAIGEVGLEPAPTATQQRFLEACLDLAQTLGLAVVLHVVGAHTQALGLLKGRSGPPVIVHYFVGDERLAARYLEVGCALSVGKPVLRNADLRQAVRMIPTERLLLETDSYPLPDRTTEPRDVVEVCRAVAELRGEAPEALAAATLGNLRHVLGMLNGDAGNGPVS
jgi:TatD DNase family protein